MSKFAKVIGVILLIVGVLCFIPNPIVGSGGVLETDFVHNLVHIVLGVLLFVWPNSTGLKVVGAIYLLVAILGFVMGGDKVLGFLTVNSADNWLHLVLGVVLLGAGLMGKGESSSPMQPV